MSRAPLVLAAVVVVAGLVALSSVQVPSGVSPSTTSPSRAPDAYQPWPSLVGIWEVRSGPETCPDAPACFVRLSWVDSGQWSLTTSADRSFDDEDPVDIESDGIRYRIVDGIVAVGEWSEPMPLELCGRMLAMARQDGPVTVEDRSPVSRPDWSVAHLEAMGSSVTCESPYGIPLAMSHEGSSWELAELEIRSPEPSELGIERILGRAAVRPPECRDGQTAFSATPAGEWLGSLASRAGFDHHPAGSGVAIRARVLTVERLVLGWVAEDGSLFEGMRATHLEDGSAADESTQPPLLAFRAGGAHIWLTVPEIIASTQSVLERVAADLRMIGADLARAAEAHLAPTPLPAGRGGLTVEESAHYSRLDVERLPAELGARTSSPGIFAQSERWRITGIPLNGLLDGEHFRPEPSLTDGSPVWSPTVESRELLAAAGGALFLAHPRVPGVDEPEVRETLEHFAGAANDCPWIGMASQD